VGCGAVFPVIYLTVAFHDFVKKTTPFMVERNSSHAHFGTQKSDSTEAVSAKTVAKPASEQSQVGKPGAKGLPCFLQKCWP
jgi:hypothetical protein